MTVGVDIDGTICDFVTTAVRYFNAALNRSVTIEAAYADYYALPTLYGLDATAFGTLLAHYEPIIYAEARPFMRARRALKDWSAAEHPLVYLTTRPASFHRLTVEWLERWEFPLGALWHVDSPADKGPLAHRLGVHALVDDHPDVYQSCQALTTVPVVVASQPYNLALPADSRVWWSDLMKGEDIHDACSIAL